MHFKWREMGLPIYAAFVILSSSTRPRSVQIQIFRGAVKNNLWSRSDYGRFDF